jgi:hypothetical protein
MKRSLVAATAVALLLTGCATGDTGHLVPDIDPELVGPSSTPAPDAGGTGGSSDGAGDSGDSDGSGDSGGATGDPTDLEDAFAESAGSQAWFGDVTEIVVDGSSVQVTTALTAAGADATAVCEAAVDAAESTGVAATSVTVLDADGAILSELDAAAGDEACSG